MDLKLLVFPALLQIIGCLVIIAEIFIPSLGLLSLMALGLFGYSLYLVFTTLSVTAFMAAVGMDLVIIPIIIYSGIQALAKSNLSLKQELSASSGVASQSEAMAGYEKKIGEAVTDLRPAGMAVIGGQRLDVVTDGEYLDAGTPIVVTRVTGNQIIVEKTK